MKPIIRNALALSILVASGVANAYEGGDWVVRGGAVMVNPDADSSELGAGGASVANSSVDVDDDTQLLLNVTYMATPNVGVELLAATPFEHDVTVDTGALGLGEADLGSVKHLPPTLSVLWYPMDAKSAFQPFIGAGVNYTVFWDENLSNVAQTALAADNLELDDSWGLAFRTGFDYMVNDCWSVHAGVYYINIETEAQLDTALGKTSVDVDINPWVYTVGLGYRF